MSSPQGPSLAGRVPVVSHAPSYLHWMRQAARGLGNPYRDRQLDDPRVSMMQGRVREAHPDPATPQLTIQLCTAGDYDFSADLGAGRFNARRRAGDILVGPPDQHLRLSGGSTEEIEITILALDWAWVREIVADQSGRVGEPSFGPMHQGLVRDSLLEALVRTTWQEAICGDPPTRLYLDSLVHFVVARLLHLAPRPRAVPKSGLSSWQLNRVMELLTQRCHEELSIATLAESVGLSCSHFARAFRLATGVPPHRRQVELRIERAKALLQQRRSSVLDVALAVGYASEPTFSRAFTAMTGQSPGRFRRMALQSEETVKVVEHGVRE